MPPYYLAARRKLYERRKAVPKRESWLPAAEPVPRGGFGTSRPDVCRQTSPGQLHRQLYQAQGTATVGLQQLESHTPTKPHARHLSHHYSGCSVRNVTQGMVLTNDYLVAAIQNICCLINNYISATATPFTQFPRYTGQGEPVCDHRH